MDIRTALSSTGFDNLGTIHHNLTAPQLYEHAIFLGEAAISAHGALVVLTSLAATLATQQPGAAFLSKEDRCVVDEPSTSGMIAWSESAGAGSNAGNKKFDAADFARLKARMAAYLQSRDVYVQECYAGSSPKYQVGMRVVTELAWQSLFARNTFVLPDEQDLKRFETRFTVVCAPNFRAMPALDGTQSAAFAIVDFAQGLVLIGGTHDAGEMQTAVFRVMNLLMPSRRVFPMNCAASVSKGGESALFFGLPGAGKATLAAELDRRLVGDSEHGWADEGIFNFAGGCYSKTLNVTLETHPALAQMTRTFGTILENTPFDSATRAVNLDNVPNARASYPRESLRLAGDVLVLANKAQHARHVVFLTCDAFGVLPPIARLTHDQAIFHFLSGYSTTTQTASQTASASNATALPASIEAVFGACYGASSTTLQPVAYAKMLRERLRKNRTTVWLINTGWTGGTATDKTGTRIKLEHTRALLKAALTGELEKMPFATEPVFALGIPTALPKQAESVPLELLDPRQSWSGGQKGGQKDAQKYDAQAQTLLAMFRENFAKFAADIDPSVLDSLMPPVQIQKGQAPQSPQSKPQPQGKAAPQDPPELFSQQNPSEFTPEFTPESTLESVPERLGKQMAGQKTVGQRLAGQKSTGQKSPPAQVPAPRDQRPARGQQAAARAAARAIAEASEAAESILPETATNISPVPVVEPAIKGKKGKLAPKPPRAATRGIKAGKPIVEEFVVASSAANEEIQAVQGFSESGDDDGGENVEPDGGTAQGGAKPFKRGRRGKRGGKS
jgi:phosphoenolpyruvate carboxykinase (ATP)